MIDFETGNRTHRYDDLSCYYMTTPLATLQCLIMNASLQEEADLIAVSCGN